MDDIDFFDKMDLKEVAKKTLIDIKDLEYLKNEDFGKLSKAKGIGFIKILEREYKIDLSDKKEKFLEYLKEYDKDTAKEFFIAPPKPPVKIFHKIVAWTLFLFIGAGVLYILYLNSGYYTSSSQAALGENRVIKEAQDISGIEVNETNITEKSTVENIQPESNIMEANTSNVATTLQENNVTMVDKNYTVANEQEKNITIKIVQSNTNFLQPQGENLSSNINFIENNITNNKNTLIIEPKNRIWVGIVDLGTYKKSSYIKDTNITIDKNSSYIVTTGHGHFKVYYRGKMTDFNTVNPVRLLVQDGNVTQIDKKEFIKLNRGKYW